MPRPHKQFTVRVDPDIHNLLRAHAFQLRIPPAQLAAQMIGDQLELMGAPIGDIEEANRNERVQEARERAEERARARAARASAPSTSPFETGTGFSQFERKR